jgi:hypothetical protein
MENYNLVDFRVELELLRNTRKFWVAIMELIFIYGPAAVGKHIYPKLPDSGLTIDTSKMSSQEAARKISEFFSLNE